MSLSESKTMENLKAAFAGESQANRRYLYFASKADVAAPTEPVVQVFILRSSVWAGARLP